MMSYAGFWIRAVAKIIDESLLSLASWLLQVLIAGAYFWVSTIGGSTPLTYEEAMRPIWVQLGFFVFYMLLSTLYYVYGHAWYGTTLGKRLFRIRVIDEQTEKYLTVSQSLWRCAAYMISSLPFGAGFFMAALHPKKKALHDLIVGSVSVRTAS